MQRDAQVTKLRGVLSRPAHTLFDPVKPLRLLADLLRDLGGCCNGRLAALDLVQPCRQLLDQHHALGKPLLKLLDSLQLACGVSGDAGQLHGRQRDNAAGRPLGDGGKLHSLVLHGGRL